MTTFKNLSKEELVLRVLQDKIYMSSYYGETVIKEGAPASNVPEYRKWISFEEAKNNIYFGMWVYRYHQGVWKRIDQ